MFLFLSCILPLLVPRVELSLSVNETKLIQPSCSPFHLTNHFSSSRRRTRRLTRTRISIFFIYKEGKRQEDRSSGTQIGRDSRERIRPSELSPCVRPLHQYSAFPASFSISLSHPSYCPPCIYAYISYPFCFLFLHYIFWYLSFGYIASHIHEICDEYSLSSANTIYQQNTQKNRETIKGDRRNRKKEG